MDARWHEEAELTAVRHLMADALVGTALERMIEHPSSLLDGGKMLRARLALRIGAALETPSLVVRPAAAAVELVHAASLLHDDVIDGGTIRRHAPSFWAERGIPAAVLFGDLMLFHAMALLDGLERYAGRLVALGGEMAQAEVEQELLLRGEPLSWEQALRVARRKTGPLFAFAAYAGAGECPDLREAIQESGFELGTAYQLADDWLDAYGETQAAGKSLGTDRARQKHTTAAPRLMPLDRIPHEMDRLLASSTARLTPWPQAQATWTHYVEDTLAPALRGLMVSGAPTRPDVLPAAG